MRKFLALSIAILMISVLMPKEVFAGAWTVPKHHVWGEVYTKYSWAKDCFEANCKRNRLPGHAWSQEIHLEPKLEFGVTDWLTALGSVAWFWGQYEIYDRPPAWGSYYAKNNGLKYITAGGRARLFTNPCIGSVQVKSWIYPGYDNGKSPTPGKGDDAIEIKGLLGKSFILPLYEKFGLPCYAGVESGYRFRNHHVANDVPIFLEGGFWPTNWFLVKGEIDSYITAPTRRDDRKESYAIWRAGGVYQVFGGDSVYRKGQLFNIEITYGQTFWGCNTTAYQEVAWKVDVQF